jgi:mono/diheme cytochrome c family protein
MNGKEYSLDFGSRILDLIRPSVRRALAVCGSNLKSKIQYPKFALVLLASFALLAGCERNEMHRQARVDPLESSDFFENGQAARHPPAGTVARGHLEVNHALYQGKVDGKLIDEFPFPITQSVLNRGRQRFNIYCSVCHGYLGDGNGMIVQRGMIRPPSYHIERLREAPVGHFYDVITNGYGAMYSYADRITPNDRWAIVAYIRALQLSQHYPENKLTPQEQARLNTHSEKSEQ